MRRVIFKQAELKRQEYQRLLDLGLPTDAIAKTLGVAPSHARRFILDQKLVRGHVIRPTHDTRPFRCMDHGDHSSSRHGQKTVNLPREPWVSK